MGVLQNLPDEILLNIINRLTLDGFYCLARTCRTFKRLSYDDDCRRQLERDFRPVLFFEDLEAHYSHLRAVYTPGVSRFEDVQVSAGPFNPPDEFMPPWNPSGPIAGQFRNRQRLVPPTPATHDMTPHRTCYNIHDWENRPVAKIAGMLLKDSLCSVCWDFRHTPAFHRRLQTLMRPLYCTGCQRYHARALFSQAAVDSGNYRHRLCLGWTSRVRICDHKNTSWQEHTQATRRDGCHCKPCKTSLSSDGISTIITLYEAKYTRKQRGIDGQSTKVRKKLEMSEHILVCPHYRLNDATVQTYLLHTIRQAYPDLDARTQASPVVKPLLDCWGKAWGCPICKTTVSLMYGFTPPSGGSPSRKRKAPCLRLMISRPLPHAQMAIPCDPRWLAQLEPSKEPRLNDARGVCWCEDESCGTSKRRRKEALLFWLLQTGVQAPAQSPPSSVAPPAGRESWLWFAFWWFWRGEEECIPVNGYKDSHRPWWLRDLDKRALYRRVLPGWPYEENPRDGNKRLHWIQAAAQHALALYNDREVASPVIKLRVEGDMHKYRTYLKEGRRNPVRVVEDCFWEGVLRRANNIDCKPEETGASTM
ncbi:hypothetical protein PG996_014034 [Apiospora saccharicola]|uniref:F-box domain-containing protein n=1 Tax=Apiospora saccharicola TaxID=335842 RepID=A0ABR1TH62_9PEZI